MQEQRNASAAGMDSTVGESSPTDRVPFKDKVEGNSEPLCLNIRQVPIEGESCQGPAQTSRDSEFHIENGIETAPNIEHQFIPCFTGRSTVHKSSPEENPESNNLAVLRNGSDEDLFFSLRLGEPEQKRRKNMNSPVSNEESKMK